MFEGEHNLKRSDIWFVKPFFAFGFFYLAANTFLGGFFDVDMQTSSLFSKALRNNSSLETLQISSPFLFFVIICKINTNSPKKKDCNKLMKDSTKEFFEAMKSNFSLWKLLIKGFSFCGICDSNVFF